jgi:hypothetical protein
MMIIFYFIFKMFENIILKVGLSKFLKNGYTCILQNELHVDEILI